jgi:hypothetical protein
MPNMLVMKRTRRHGGIAMARRWASGHTLLVAVVAVVLVLVLVLTHGTGGSHGGGGGY